ncbi:RNA polymerase subunit sigma-70 [Amycolatopsis australiensis]|uniref:RNA polymerase sigma-70 factor, ECF subfamily n=1 Tax=Amycolatopsis australiensis TaxID=546364 RepID=A0A1K1SPP7_9PSEU|nr:RNA polymerase subunit sigma-70 [Amycolatopsis australiensis]SFW86384.1 RNA polymerase sigma-70 factor, ECF subfamily [Amycolatopsis australiensis]
MLTTMPGRAAFEAQLGPLRRELAGYCYRMLGSAFDADDAVQETLLRAWRGLDRFAGRAALRTWLFTIATHVCLDALQDARRRALPANVTDELGPAHPREAWIEPVPDRWVLDPARAAVDRESVRLAFVAALQVLSPRQRAVLLLRDVLRWRAKEVATLLDTTEDAVNAVLKRARAALPAPDPAPLSGDDRALLARYVEAFERFDIDALVALLHEEATLSMPPYDVTLRGRASIAAWFRSRRAACEDAQLVPVDVNGGLGLAQYRRGSPFAIHAFTTAAGRITAVHTFLDPALFPLFGLPEAVP